MFLSAEICHQLLDFFIFFLFIYTWNNFFSLHLVIFYLWFDSKLDLAWPQNNQKKNHQQKKIFFFIAVGSFKILMFDICVIRWSLIFYYKELSWRKWSCNYQLSVFFKSFKFVWQLLGIVLVVVNESATMIRKKILRTLWKVLSNLRYFKEVKDNLWNFRIKKFGGCSGNSDEISEI